MTITTSPCVDRYTTVPALVPGSKMACGPNHLYAGGGGINVARVIKRLGADVTALYPAGGFTGEHFNRLLHEDHVTARIIAASRETRENFIVMDEQSGLQYRFGMPGTELSADEWQAMLLALQEMDDVSWIVASGSLAPGVPDDFFARVARIAKNKNAKLVLDTSRKPLQLALEEGVYLVKPNLREVSHLSGSEVLAADAIWKAGMALIQNKMAELVVISMGEKGAWLLEESGRRLISPPGVPVKSTVGAGDSMVAGITWMLSRGESVEHAVAFGVACGSAATLRPGVELCDPGEAESLYDTICRQHADIIITPPGRSFLPV